MLLLAANLIQLGPKGQIRSDSAAVRLPPDGFSSGPVRSSKGSKSANVASPLDSSGSSVVVMGGRSASQPRPAQTPASSASQGTIVVGFQEGMVKW